MMNRFLSEGVAVGAIAKPVLKSALELSFAILQNTCIPLLIIHN